jgi:hypothetical protein
MGKPSGMKTEMKHCLSSDLQRKPQVRQTFLYRMVGPGSVPCRAFTAISNARLWATLEIRRLLEQTEQMQQL